MRVLAIPTVAAFLALSGLLPAGNVQYLRILVRKLRQKVEIDPTRPLLIVSESGVGYRLALGSDGSLPATPPHRAAA
jgi:hypothetical protein